MHKHLIGNYGTAWYNQHEEFSNFNGAVLMTTNCIKNRKESYKERDIYYRARRLAGCSHIEDRGERESKDFTPVIDKPSRSAALVKKAPMKKQRSLP